MPFIGIKEKVMARDETWQFVKKYFKPDSKVDNWGDADAISDTHILRLYEFRSFLGTPVIVTHGVKTSGHAKGSFHYKQKDQWGNEIAPCATDIIIPNYQFSPYDLILDATRFGFTGIGYYPHWRYKGEVVGGLHVDSRPVTNKAHARWIGYLDENGKQVYTAMNFTTLMKLVGQPLRTYQA